MVFRCVNRNSVQPGIKSTVAAELRQCPVRLDKGFLGHVECLGLIADIPHDQFDDLVLILEHQYVEGPLVTILDTLDKPLIVRPSGHGIAC